MYIFVPKVCPVKMHFFRFANIIYPDLLVANLARWTEKIKCREFWQEVRLVKSKITHQRLYRSKKILCEYSRLSSPALEVCVRNVSCGEERGKTAVFTGYKVNQCHEKENQVRYTGFANTPNLEYFMPNLFRWLHWSYGGSHFDSKNFR